MAALKAYCADKIAELCDDCQARFHRNPLRLLDCKVPKCQPIADAAPKTLAYLCPDCADHFARLRRYLDALGITYALSAW